MFRAALWNGLTQTLDIFIEQKGKDFMSKDKAIKAVEGIEAVEIDFESVEDGVWFPFQNSHLNKETDEWVFDEPIAKENGPRVKVRLIFPFVKKRFAERKKEVEYKLNTKTRKMDRDVHYKELTPEEEQKATDDTWDYAIIDFENFKNKGEIIKCTRENKLRMMEVPIFDRFIGHCLKILEGSEAEEIKATEKN